MHMINLHLCRILISWEMLLKLEISLLGLPRKRNFSILFGRFRSSHYKTGLTAYLNLGLRD